MCIRDREYAGTGKRDLLLSQICDVDFSFSLSRTSILQQFSGVAGRMPHIGDEKIAALHHISVCADDGKPFGDRFQIRRIERGDVYKRQPVASSAASRSAPGSLLFS